MKNTLPIVFLLLSLLFFCRCSTSKKLRQTEENMETVRIWFEDGWNKQNNLELISRVFAEDWSDGNPIRPDQTDGFDGIREMVKFYYTAFPDAQFTITHLFGDDTHVAIRYEVVATHQGDAFGIPATGREFTSTGVVLYEMENGKIKRSWQELDLMGIIRQLKE